ncbi:uncharacterized protein LOC143917428 [Arctopsyche grandis]|uniref:uncharacterized protein LOC143917428 n=1 Tax=Arctopsyche grandis TaxID=121162 RepID=UPI00406D94FB
MGASFLPSEVARLVLGYLLDEDCIKAYNEFFNASKHLEECRGRGFFTKIMGMSLIQILDDYCAVQFLVTSINCANDFKKAIDKCSTLEDKVKVLIKFADTLRTEQSNSNSNKAIIHVNEPPISNSYKVLDLSTKASYLRTHSRRNSCDSIVTIRTEKSHKCCLHSKDNKECRKDNHIGSVENPIEGTNLADLPGHKDDFDRQEGPSKGKEHIFNDFLNSIDSQSRPLKYQRKELSKSFDSGLDAIRPHLDDNGTDFRHALGLMKHGDIPDKASKTPVKRKSIKTRGCFSARKLNHTEKNDPFDVTVIANAFLDFPELHEKLADNINKLFSSSLNKTEFIDFTLKDGQDVSTPKDLKKVHDSTAFDDDSQQIESVIKSIVEKTEKDPMFDQLVNEVLATSRGNFSGSESDVLSRPETSTPEKSFNSLSNACSPTSSIFSFEDSNNKFPCDNVGKRKLRSWKSSKVECQQDRSYIKDEHMLNTSMKMMKSDPKCTPSNSETRYPRRPRGGKKMDVLKANYERTSIEENELDPKDLSLCVPSNEEILPQVDDINTLPSAPEQKIIILSNERVHTNILSNNGSIIIRDPKSSADENIKPLHTPCSSQNLAVENVYNPNLGTEIVTHQDTTNNQHAPMPVATFKKSTNVTIQRAKIISPDISPDPHFHKLLEFSKLPSIDTMRESANTSTKIFKNLNEEVKNLRSFRHKMSEKSCTASTIQTANLQTSKGFTEAEIMKMPTLIMVKDMNSKIDMKPATLTEDFYGDVAFDKSKESNFINIVSQVQTLNEFSLLDTSSIEKPSIDIKIFDAKGLDVFPSESSTTMAEANATVPYIIQSEMNINSGTEAEFVKVNSLIDVLEHGNLVIDDGKRDESESDRTYGKLMVYDDRSKIVNLDLKSGSNSDACNSNLKTPDAVNNFKKKLCSSTPTKKNSHIRVLDFSTPEKSEVNNKRKALTSPKQMVPNKSRIQRFNRIGKKFSSNPKAEQSSKTCLFNAIVEEDSVCESKIVIETVSVSNSEISEVCKTNLNKENIGLRDNSDVTVSLNVDLNKNQPKIKKSVSSWDRDLRATAISNNPPVEVSHVNKKKHVKKSIGKARKNGSIKVQAKMLEEALLDKSLESVTGAESKSNVSGDGKAIHEEDKPAVKANDCKLSESYVLSTVIEDLELSTNTTIDEGRKDGQTLKHLASDPSCKKVSEGPSGGDNNGISKASSHSDSIKHERNSKNKSVDLVKESSVPLGMGKNKKTPKTKSTFKVKILSKANVDGHSKNGSNSAAFKTNKNESLPKTSITPKSVLNDSKLSEMEIPGSSHITPELPRECRSNPINIKCNLNALLETPIKTDLLDITMATPRFLSPVHNTEPISAVKMLGMPTPIFGNTPIVSTSKATRLASTPDSSKKGYSSGSSYYMPDEVDKWKEPPVVVVSKKKPVSNGKSETKNTSPLNKSSRILRPRRSNRVKVFSKKGSPLHKTKTVKKKPKVVSNAKNKTGKRLDTSQNSKSQSYSSVSLSISDEFSDIEEPPVKKPVKSSKSKAKTVELNENIQSNEVPTTSNTDKKDPLALKVLEVKTKRSDLEETRLRVLAKCNAEMKTAPPKKKPFVKSMMAKNQPFFKFTSASLSNEDRLKKLNAIKVTKCQSVSFMPSPKVSDKLPPPKSDDKLNKRKSFTPRKLESKQCETTMSREDATPHLLNSSLKSYKSCIDLSKTEVGRAFTTNTTDPVEVSASRNVSDDSGTQIEHQKSENSPDEQANDIVHPFDAKTDLKKNDSVKEIVEAPKDIEKNTSSTDVSLCNAESVNELYINETIVMVEKSSTKVQSEDSIKKTEECRVPFSEHKTEPSLENVDKPSSHETSGDTSTTDLNEPCVDIEWSKSDGTCLHMTYDTTQKSKRKAAKSQDKFDLDNLEINVEIFDTAIDDMRMISLKSSKYMCLLDMAPNPKLKKASETVKVARTKKQTKVSNEPKSNLLQLLIDEMSNSTTESLSPIKSFEPVNSVVYEVDSCYPDSETLNAVKAILPENSPSYSHNVTAGSNQNDVLDLKQASVELEVVDENDLSGKCVDAGRSEPLHMITIDGEKVTKDSKTHLEKRKREDEGGEEHNKKSKSETINIDTKFDIETVLRHLHGY